MKRLSLHLAAAVIPVAAVIVAVFSMAAYPFSAPREAPPPAGLAQDPAPGLAQEVVEAKVELLLHMKGMEELGKSLRRSVRKVETHPTALEEVAEYQRLCVLAKSLPPPMMATLPEADRPAFLRDYRKGMLEVLVELCTLEKALLEADVDQAQEILKVLKELEAGGHERFMPEEG